MGNAPPRVGEDRTSSSDSEDPLLSDRDHRLLLLTLNRPERLNAVSPDLYRALLHELEEAAEDSEVGTVVITGSGRAFSAGADLQAHGSGPPDAEQRKRYARLAQEVNRRLQTLSKPVVAAMNGHAVGAGLELALSCDLLVVAERAKLRLPEAALGTFVGGGVTYTLPARVGSTRARELLLLGRFFRGHEALEMGLVNRAVPAEEVLETSLQLAREVASHAPLSLRLMKEIMDRAEVESPDTILHAEEDALLRCMETRDWREGVEAFRDGREPRFTGA